MFEQTLLIDAPSRRDTSIAFALGLQILLVAGSAVLSIWGVEPLSRGTHALFLIAPLPLLAPAPPEVRTHRASPAHSVPAAAVPLFRPPLFRAPSVHPLRAPSNVVSATLFDAPTLSVPGARNSGTSGIAGGLGTLVNSQPPPLPRRPSAPHAPLRIPSSISQSQLLYGPKPAYPKLALTARVEGTVRLQATISRQGRIENLRLLSGHPLLINAALEEVKHWRYRPVILNGDPVDVITEIAVNFTLR